MLLHSVIRSAMSCPRPTRSVNQAPCACLEPLEDRRLMSGSPQADVAASDNPEAVTTPSLHAAPFSDPRGDILPTYTGGVLPGMDVVAHKVTLDGDRMVFFGKMAGRVAQTQEVGALYLFGVDRGRGTARFLPSPTSPPVIGPNVLWDSIVRINPDGTGLFNNSLMGVVTPLDPADIKISGNHFTASVPLRIMLPGATRPPEEWTYNLWPRNGIGRNVQVSDLAPDDGNAPVQALSRDGSSGHGQEGPAEVVAPREAVVFGNPHAAAAPAGRDTARIVDDVLGTGPEGIADPLN